MPLRVVCPEGCRFTAPTRQAGRQVRCPRCRTVMRIPSLEEPVESGGTRMISLNGERVGDSQPETLRGPASTPPPPLPTASAPSQPPGAASKRPPTPPPPPASAPRPQSEPPKTETPSSLDKSRAGKEAATKPGQDSAASSKAKVKPPSPSRTASDSAAAAASVPATVEAVEAAAQKVTAAQTVALASTEPVAAPTQDSHPQPTSPALASPAGPKLAEAAQQVELRDELVGAFESETQTQREPIAEPALDSTRETLAEAEPTKSTEPDNSIQTLAASAPQLTQAAASQSSSSDDLQVVGPIAFELDSSRLAQFERRRHQGVFETSRRSVCRIIAFCVLLVGVANGLLGAWLSGWLTSPATATLPSWAVVLIFMGALHASYAAFLAQVADWSAHWVSATFLLMVALICAAAGVLLGLAPTEHPLIRMLELPRLLQLKGAIWMTCMVLMSASLAWWSGREALYWRSIMSRLQTVPIQNA